MIRHVAVFKWKPGFPDKDLNEWMNRLRAIPEGTELTLTHELLHDEQTRRSHEDGWAGALDKLLAHFADGKTL